MRAFAWQKSKFQSQLTAAQKGTVKQEVNAYTATQLQQHRTTLNSELEGNTAIDAKVREGDLRGLSLELQLKVYRFEICEARNTILAQSTDQLRAIRGTIAGRIGGTTEIEVDEYKLSLIDARLDTANTTPDPAPEPVVDDPAPAPEPVVDDPAPAPEPAQEDPTPQPSPGASTTDSGAAASEPTTTKTEGSSSSVMFSASLDVTESRKFAFDASGASKIDALLVSVPPPTAYVEALKADALGRAKVASGS